MKYKVTLSDKAQKDIWFHQKTSPANFKKTMKLIAELYDHPRSGTGHPEPLKGGGGDIYSRKINSKDRLIYKIFDDTILVVVASAKGHYDDK